MGSYLSLNVLQGVNLAFTAIAIVPLVVIMCIAYRRAPRSKDPARVTITYFKVMLPLAITWHVMFLIAGILGFVLTFNLNRLDGDSVQHAQLRIASISSLASYLSDFLLIVILVEMGNGFLFCLADTRTGLQKAMRYIAIGTCAILSVLAISVFGIANALFSQYINSLWFDYDQSLDIARGRLGTAIVVLTFVWAVALVAFAAIVFHKTKRNYVLKNSAMLFLIATVLNFISHLYLLIYVAVFFLSGVRVYEDYDTYTAIMFVDPILSIWTWVAAVSLVCTVVIRKHNGLWATMQPWMDAQVGPPALAANPNYKGSGVHSKDPSDRHVVGV